LESVSAKCIGGRAASGGESSDSGSDEEDDDDENVIDVVPIEALIMGILKIIKLLINSYIIIFY
jgi:hypothetical protein